MARRRIRGRLNGLIQIGVREFAVSASLGMAIFPDHGQTPDTLIGNADAAMYDAKRAGSRSCCLFDAGRRKREPEAD